MKTAARSLLLLVASLLPFTAAAEEVTLVHGAVTLRGELEKTAGWPAGPVLLITHGTLAHNHMEIIAALQKAFKERGYSSLAVNLSLGLDRRPSAMYDCATPHTHRQEDAVGELRSWQRWLELQGVTQLALVGHSRGGAQTAWFAAEHDSPTMKAVVLLAPATGEDPARDYEKAAGKPLAPVLEEAQALVAAGKGDTLLDTPFLHCEKARASAASFVSYYGPEPRRDTADLLPKIAKPVLVIAGSEDTTVPHLVERIRPLADGGHITLQVIDGADHFFRDLNAEDAADAAVRFLKAHGVQ